MRRHVILCFAVCSAAAVAEPAEKGQIGVSLKLSPLWDVDRARPVASFQLSPRFAIRPHLGFGFGRERRVGPVTAVFEDGGRLLNFDLGATGVFTLRPGKSWSPYGGVGLTYSYADPVAPFFRLEDGGVPVIGPQPAAPATPRNFVTVSALAGLQYRINRRFTLFGEVGMAATPGERYEWTGRDWRRLSAFGDARRPFRSGFGLTVNVK
jgi:hypothetical protein